MSDPNDAFDFTDVENLALELADHNPTGVRFRCICINNHKVAVFVQAEKGKEADEEVDRLINSAANCFGKHIFPYSLSQSIH